MRLKTLKDVVSAGSVNVDPLTLQSLLKVLLIPGNPKCFQHQASAPAMKKAIIEARYCPMAGVGHNYFCRDIVHDSESTGSSSTPFSMSQC